MDVRDVMDNADDGVQRDSLPSLTERAQSARGGDRQSDSGQRADDNEGTGKDRLRPASAAAGLRLRLPNQNKSIHHAVKKTLEQQGVVFAIRKNAPALAVKYSEEKTKKALNQLRLFNPGTGRIESAENLASKDTMPYHLLAIGCLLYGTGQFDYVQFLQDLWRPIQSSVQDDMNTYGAQVGYDILEKPLRESSELAYNNYVRMLFASKDGSMIKPYFCETRQELFRNWLSHIRGRVAENRRRVNQQAMLQCMLQGNAQFNHGIPEDERDMFQQAIDYDSSESGDSAGSESEAAE